MLCLWAQKIGAGFVVAKKAGDTKLPASKILNLFNIDDVGIARLPVRITSRDNDAVALFDESEIDRGAFRVVEQDVHRSKFFRQNRDDAPGEGEFAIRHRFDGHAYDVDVGAEA